MQPRSLGWWASLTIQESLHSQWQNVTPSKVLSFVCVCASVCVCVWGRHPWLVLAWISTFACLPFEASGTTPNASQSEITPSTDLPSCSFFVNRRSFYKRNHMVTGKNICYFTLVTMRLRWYSRMEVIGVVSKSASLDFPRG